jgi:hypothetical protein
MRMPRRKATIEDNSLRQHHRNRRRESTLDGGAQSAGSMAETATNVRQGHHSGRDPVLLEIPKNWLRRDRGQQQRARQRNRNADAGPCHRTWACRSLPPSSVTRGRSGSCVLRLRKLHDVVIQRPCSFENFSKNIATGIYNAAHPDTPLRFNIDFCALA